MHTALHALQWDPSDLDHRYPAHVAYANAEHLILAVHNRERLARLDYDFAELDEVMAQRHWTTLQLVHAHNGAGAISSRRCFEEPLGPFSRRLPPVPVRIHSQAPHSS